MYCIILCNVLYCSIKSLSKDGPLSTPVKHKLEFYTHEESMDSPISWRTDCSLKLKNSIWPFCSWNGTRPFGEWSKHGKVPFRNRWDFIKIYCLFLNGKRPSYGLFRESCILAPSWPQPSAGARRMGA